MNDTLCNVALAVRYAPRLPTKFRIASPRKSSSVPALSFRFATNPGRRSHRMGRTRPPGTKLREVQKCLDVLPALTKNLLDLGQWISSYYLAPIGEVYRAMLPPLTELRAQQIVRITELGRSSTANLLVRWMRSQLFFKIAIRKRRIAAADRSPFRARAWGTAQSAASRLRGNPPANPNAQAPYPANHRLAQRRNRLRCLTEKEVRLRDMLLLQRGALPLTQLLKLGNVSRTSWKNCCARANWKPGKNARSR